MLVDFRWAKHAIASSLGQAGTSIGSPEFVAPEQAREKVLFNSDLYSLGVTCIYRISR